MRPGSRLTGWPVNSTEQYLIIPSRAHLGQRHRAIFPVGVNAEEGPGTAENR
jgi:hypothetical protein